MRNLLIVFVLLAYGAPCIYGYFFPCPPCEEFDLPFNCMKPSCEASGKILRLCGCCHECDKQVGEICGGDEEFLQICDKNLTCNFTREEIEKDSEIPPVGVCSDAQCKAIVDIVIALDGSDSISESNFGVLKKWIINTIRMLYERYGACAHIGLLEYAGSSTKNFILPFGLGVCTNNEDCYGERLKNLTRLDMDGAFTHQALLTITQDILETSNRTERSQKLIFVITDELPANASAELEKWKNTSSTHLINTYVLGVSFPAENGSFAPQLSDWSGVISGSGKAWNVQFPIGNETIVDMVDTFWEATVKVPVTCKYPEEYEPCKSTSCAPTCDDPDALCPLKCDEPGCVCAFGYIRLGKVNDSCVYYGDCPQQQCINPEVYRSCSKVCNATCDDPDPICDEKCGPPKCQCGEGYVWKSDEDRTCIFKERCSELKCPGEGLTHCFPKACEVKKCPAFPEAECKQKCNGCVFDFYDKDGNNITDKCYDVECPPHEVYQKCAKSCTPTCEDPKPFCFYGPVCNPSRCECEDGYVRRSLENTTCIEMETCPAVQECDDAKVYRVCPPVCHPTCASPDPYCGSGCGRDHCVCPTGQVLYSWSDHRCVHVYECPARNCMRQCPEIDMASAGACKNRFSIEA